MRYLWVALAGGAGAVTVGFIGAYTTFSTFAWESFVLGRSDRVGIAAVYISISIAGGLAAAWAGYQLARTVAQQYRRIGAR